MRDVLTDQWRILTFRAPSREFVSNPEKYVVFGMLVTWLAGLGRYWDHPEPEWYQSFGLISVTYVVVLSGVLWLVHLPLSVRRQTYAHVLAFVTFTSAPALLYAVPVERFIGVELAAITNLFFLLVVAGWRVALLVWYMRKAWGLGIRGALVAAAFPISVILIVLAALNVTEVVMRSMAGIRTESAEHISQDVVVLVGFWTVFVSPVVVLAYLGLAYHRRKMRNGEHD